MANLNKIKGKKIAYYSRIISKKKTSRLIQYLLFFPALSLGCCLTVEIQSKTFPEPKLSQNRNHRGGGAACNVKAFEGKKNSPLFCTPSISGQAILIRSEGAHQKKGEGVRVEGPSWLNKPTEHLVLKKKERERK